MTLLSAESLPKSRPLISKEMLQARPHLAYHRMEHINFNHLFESCTKLSVVKRLHALLVVSGKVLDLFVSTRLVNLYSFYGDVSLARRSFDRIPLKDIYTWNSMISAYVRTSRLRDALECFSQFSATSGIQPNEYTFPPVLKACRDLSDGKKIHCQVLKMGFHCDIHVSTSLLHMYTKFGFVSIARELFNEVPVRDAGTWNAMISGFCQNGDAENALQMLNEMRSEGESLNPVAVASILAVCVQSDDVLNGMLIHLSVVKQGLEIDLFVCNALINMYAKFGFLGSAQSVFDGMVVKDLVSWNSIIAAYELNGDSVTALGYFNKLQNDGVKPDLVTLLSLASVVAQLADHEKVRPVHGFILRRGWIFEDVAIGNAVVDMYAKSGALDSSRLVFDGLPDKDIVSWNTLITGYAQNGLADEAIELYNKMEQSENLSPDQGTWVSVIPAYSHLGALQKGMKIHGRVIKNQLHKDVYVGTCLIDMYGKCGRLEDAMSLFHEVPRKTSVPWNAIIFCHGVHGQAKKALKLFKEMIGRAVKPDRVTFTTLLTACSHSGLVDEGKRYFHAMQEQYGIKPSYAHYGSMVDLLGRAGHLDEAYDLMKSMPIQPDASIWGALLGACRIHGNVELGKLASTHLFEVDPENIGYYVLLSNIYANSGKWEGVNKVRSLARDKGLRKTPGWSSIEIDKKVNVFYTGNGTHPKYKEIWAELTVMNAKMKTLGYIPDFSFVLQDVEEDEKEQILSSHNERLAIAFGLISTPPRTTIRIFKNLRVCGDCHNVTKYISRITEREIIVRDSNRFHHFKDGACSCGDYW